MSGSAPRKLVGISMAVEKTLASVLESTPVQGDSPGRGEVGEVALAGGVEQVFDAVEVEEERVTAGTGEEREVARRCDVGFIADEGDRNLREELLAYRLDRLGVLVCRQVDVDGLLAIARFGEDVAESDVVQQISVIVDRHAVDRIGVQGIGQRVGIEDDDRPRRVGRRDERVQVAEIQTLVAQRGPEAQPGEVVGHAPIAFSVEGAGQQADRTSVLSRLKVKPGKFT